MITDLLPSKSRKSLVLQKSAETMTTWPLPYLTCTYYEGFGGTLYVVSLCFTVPQWGLAAGAVHIIHYPSIIVWVVVPSRCLYTNNLKENFYDNLVAHHSVVTYRILWLKKQQYVTKKHNNNNENMFSRCFLKTKMRRSISKY